MFNIQATDGCSVSYGFTDDNTGNTIIEFNQQGYLHALVFRQELYKLKQKLYDLVTKVFDNKKGYQRRRFEDWWTWLNKGNGNTTKLDGSLNVDPSNLLKIVVYHPYFNNAKNKNLLAISALASEVYSYRH